MRRYLAENGQKLQILSILIFFVMVIGIVTGSVFYMKTGDARAAVNEHFSDIFRTVSETENPLAAAENLIVESAVTCLVIFAGAWFRAGALLTVFTVLRRGFITGFTAASAAGAYGIKGMLIMGTSAAELIIGTMVLVIFSAVSVAYSIEREKSSKKFLIFFAIFAISIFCIISFWRGFSATTFMKWIYPKIA